MISRLTHQIDPTISAEPASIATARSALPIDDILGRAKESLIALAPSLGDFIGDLPPKVFGVETGFFHLPFAQALCWGVPADDWLTDLGVATVLGSTHFAAQDLAIDTGRCTADLLLLMDAAQTLYSRAMDYLCPNARFRQFHDRYFSAYSAAVLSEQSHRGALFPHTAAEILESGDKAAPGNTVFVAIVSRTNQWRVLPGIESSMRHLCAGLQICDDIGDLADDLEWGYYSFPAATTLLRCMGEPPGIPRTNLDHAEIESRMYLDGVATAAYELAVERFDRCAAISQKADARAIADFAAHCRDRAQGRVVHIDQVVDRMTSHAS